MSARSCSRASARHRVELRVGHHRTGRIVRADHDDGAHPSAPSLLAQVLHVELPSAVKLETVMLEGHAVEIGQVLDQRIARPRRQHRIARIAQQLEQQRIRLARAGGQHDSIGGNQRDRAARSHQRRLASPKAARRVRARSDRDRSSPSGRAAHLDMPGLRAWGWRASGRQSDSPAARRRSSATASRLRPAAWRRREENISGSTLETARGCAWSPRSIEHLRRQILRIRDRHVADGAVRIAHRLELRLHETRYMTAD